LEAYTAYNHEKKKQKNEQRKKEKASHLTEELLAASQGTTPSALDDTKKLVPILHLTSKIAY
jgi:hypothetical protein